MINNKTELDPYCFDFWIQDAKNGLSGMPYQKDMMISQEEYESNQKKEWLKWRDNKIKSKEDK